MRRTWSWGLLLALAGLVLLVLVAVMAWFVDHRPKEPTNVNQAPPIAAPPPVQVAAPPPAPAKPVPPPPSAPIQVSLDFNKDCWVEAVSDGKVHLAELRIQGESMQVEAQKSLTLTLGNAGVVDMRVNGYPFPLNKKDGEVVKNLVIDLDTVQTLKAKQEAH